MVVQMQKQVQLSETKEYSCDDSIIKSYKINNLAKESQHKHLRKLKTNVQLMIFLIYQTVVLLYQILKVL